MEKVQRLKCNMHREKETIKQYMKEYKNSSALDIQNIEELKNANDDENEKEIKKYNNIRKSFLDTIFIL